MTIPKDTSATPTEAQLKARESFAKFGSRSENPSTHYYHYLEDIYAFGAGWLSIHSDGFKHIPLKDIHRETLNLLALYEQSPLIVNAYTDEMDMLSYYDVQKWISENKELVQAMLDRGDA